MFIVDGIREVGRPQFCERRSFVVAWALPYFRGWTEREGTTGHRVAPKGMDDSWGLRHASLTLEGPKGNRDLITLLFTMPPASCPFTPLSLFTLQHLRPATFNGLRPPSFQYESSLKDYDIFHLYWLGTYSRGSYVVARLVCMQDTLEFVTYP